MKLTLRWKVTLWFAIVLACVVALSFVVAFVVSDAVLQQGVRDSLVMGVVSNADEISAYAAGEASAKAQNEAGRYFERGSYVIEVEEDYIASANGIGVALYEHDGQMMYGRNAIAREVADLPLANGKVRAVEANDVRWYVFDQALEGEGLEGLFLRGTVSSEQAALSLSSIVHVSLLAMAALLVIGVAGGYLIARRQLKPIDKITATARQVGETYDLGQRVGLGEGGDELHELATSFDAMVQRLEGAFEAQQRFTSDASHELRTPTAVILAQCDYTLSEERSPEEYQEALQTVQRQGTKLSGIVSNMLEMSRIEQRSDAYPFEEVDLSQVVSSAAVDAIRLANERGIAISTDVAPAVHMYGNQVLLGHMVDNLASNAIRYGTDDGQVQISMHAANGTATITVTDDGIGISEEDQQRIFERFYQADPARSQEGSGLGLPLVRQIAELHGGTVSVQSKLGHGSTFTISLPCAEVNG